MHARTHTHTFHQDALKNEHRNSSFIMVAEVPATSCCPKGFSESGKLKEDALQVTREDEGGCVFMCVLVESFWSQLEWERVRK